MTSTQRATSVAVALAIVLAVVIGALLPIGHTQPRVTICHTQAQTHCLWINGSADWR